MKTTIRSILIALAALSSSAYASSSSTGSEGGLLVSLFLGFFALIIIFQLVPATLMMIGVLRGLFGRDRKEVKASR